jgi:hypothetical protein
MLGRRTAVCVAVLGAALAVSGVSVAGAAAGGAVQIWGTPANGGGGHVVFTGAIADSGRAANADAAGKPTKTGGYKLLTLRKGTILLNGKRLKAALNNPKPSAFNSTTCSGDFVAKARSPIVSGTGAYAGISGTFHVTVTFAIVLPLTKGKCNTNTSANPVAEYGSISGTGTVSFG